MLVSLVPYAQAAKLVYVLPLGDEIGPMTWLYTRDALAEAEEKRADLFVVELNTYGGALQDADSIRTALLRCQIPTVAFIDHNAASAGALIALACDSVYMSHGSSMGAATV
ncbi:MAG: nodulation protein NfeD, partial [Muribaculaceae bacterium]|nr:nodulation protein NfeD [Muribaculaceae bacterium]